jgi:hypothetical protein
VARLSHVVVFCSFFRRAGHHPSWLMARHYPAWRFGRVPCDRFLVHWWRFAAALYVSLAAVEIFLLSEGLVTEVALIWFTDAVPTIIVAYLLVVAHFENALRAFLQAPTTFWDRRYTVVGPDSLDGENREVSRVTSVP